MPSRFPRPAKVYLLIRGIEELHTDTGQRLSTLRHRCTSMDAPGLDMDYVLTRKEARP